MNKKEIDFLFEDPPLPSQKYALISIVGPHMPQKCDVWGIKIRGTASSEQQALDLSKRLNEIDPDYDIYTAEVGKFFPLKVSPHEIDQVHSNSQLNELIKNYKNNKEQATQHFYERKNQMIKDAIREGREHNDLDKEEHPTAVLYRIKTLKDKQQELTELLQKTETELKDAEAKFSLYSEEERLSAEKEFQTEQEPSDSTEKSVETLRETLEPIPEQETEENLSSVINDIQLNEKELDELKRLRNDMTRSTNQLLYNKLTKSIQETESKIKELKEKLTNGGSVNSFMKSQFETNTYSYLE